MRLTFKKELFLFGIGLWLVGASWQTVAAGQDTGYAPSPSERIRANTLKAQENPSLRGRWIPEFYTPSRETYVTDNLAMKILSELKSQGVFAQSPVHLKVKSMQGRVTLEGTATSAAERQTIEAKVRRMEGVRAVDNRLGVRAS